jgi:anti-sigma factor RsiW
MPCPYTPEDLSAYVDGELDPTLAGEVREHLRACPTCEQEVAWLRDVTGMVRAVPHAAPKQATAWKAESLSAREPRRLQCTVVLTEASALIDGELSDEEALDVQAHLYACESCYHAYRQLGEVAEALQATEPAPAPAGLEQRVWAAIEAEQRPVAVVGQWVRRALDFSIPGLHGTARLAVAAAFVLLVWSAVWHFVGPYGAKPTPSAPGGNVATVTQPAPAAPRPAPRRSVPPDLFKVEAPPPLPKMAAAPQWQPGDIFSAVEKALRPARGGAPTPGTRPAPPLTPRGPLTVPPPPRAIAEAPTIRPPSVPVIAPTHAPGAPTPPGGSPLFVTRPVTSGGQSTIPAPAPSALTSVGAPKTAPPSDRGLSAPPPTRVAERSADSSDGPEIEVRVPRSPAAAGTRPPTGIDRSPLDAEAGRIGGTLQTAKRAKPAQWNVPIR